MRICHRMYLKATIRLIVGEMAMATSEKTPHKLKTKKVPVGIIHGKFQILHNDHLKYLLAAKERCGFLFVGITNPDPTLTKESPEDPARSKPSNNPFTYWERYLMVEAALLGAGVKREEFAVVPFPINYPELLKYYTPTDARYYTVVYDAWGAKKAELLKSLGLDVEVMWEKDLSEKGLSATQVRSLIAANGDWKGMVPPSVADVIEKLGLDKKLRNFGVAARR